MHYKALAIILPGEIVQSSGGGPDLEIKGRRKGDDISGWGWYVHVVVNAHARIGQVWEPDYLEQDPVVSVRPCQGA